MFKLDEVLEEYLLAEGGIFSGLKDNVKNAYRKNAINNLNKTIQKLGGKFNNNNNNNQPKNPMPKEEYEKEWKPKIDALINKVKSEVIKLSKNKKYKSIAGHIHFDTKEEDFPILISITIENTTAANMKSVYDFMDENMDVIDEFDDELCPIIERLIDKAGLPAEYYSHSGHGEYFWIYIDLNTKYDGIEK